MLVLRLHNKLAVRIYANFTAIQHNDVRHETRVAKGIDTLTLIGA